MKYLLILLAALPLFSVGQTKSDYDNTMKRFVSYYNEGAADKICSLFPIKKNQPGSCFWKSSDSPREQSVYERYGKIKNYEYLGIDETESEKVRVYKVLFANAGEKVMSFNIKNNKFGTFRFETTSDEIEKMLAKKK